VEGTDTNTSLQHLNFNSYNKKLAKGLLSRLGLLALTANIGQGWKWFPVFIQLTYNSAVSITTAKSLIVQV
jgi:hypothetical protein